MVRSCGSTRWQSRPVCKRSTCVFLTQGPTNHSSHVRERRSRQLLPDRLDTTRAPPPRQNDIKQHCSFQKSRVSAGIPKPVSAMKKYFQQINTRGSSMFSRTRTSAKLIHSRIVLAELDNRIATSATLFNSPFGVEAARDTLTYETFPNSEKNGMSDAPVRASPFKQNGWNTARSM